MVQTALTDEELPSQSCVIPRSGTRAGWAAGLLNGLRRLLGLGRIYAPEEQLYLSSVKSLIYRETLRGKAISLKPAKLGIYNCSARESSSLPSAAAAAVALGSSLGTPRGHAPRGLPWPQQPPSKL